MANAKSAEPAKPVTVVVVDDHEIVRAGLAALLDREKDIQVVGMGATGEEALALVEEIRPDILVLDYSLPKMSGVEVCEEVSKTHREVAVIMLTSFLDDVVVRRSLLAGAQAFVYKDVEGRDLKRAIRAVAQGEAVLDPKVAGRVMGWVRGEKRPRMTKGREALSWREIQLLRLVARGRSNKEIAKALDLNINTVKTYLLRSYKKLGCHGRSEAVSIASKWGIL